MSVTTYLPKNRLKRESRKCWIEGAKHGLSGGNFGATPYPVDMKDKTGAPLWKAQAWARGYWWSQRCLQGINKRVQSFLSAGRKVQRTVYPQPLRLASGLGAQLRSE